MPRPGNHRAEDDADGQHSDFRLSDEDHDPEDAYAAHDSYLFEHGALFDEDPDE